MDSADTEGMKVAFRERLWRFKEWAEKFKA